MTPSGKDAERISALLAAAGLTPARSFEALDGTGNRTFVVAGTGYEVVVRLPGRDTAVLVDRVAEAHNAQRAAALGVAPAVIHHDPVDGAMVMARAAGHVLPAGPVAGRDRALERLGRCLFTLHGGPRFLGRMDPWQKIAAYLDTAGLPEPQNEAAFGALWPRVAALRGRTMLEEQHLTPCHVDPVPANAIDDGRRVLLVDWEYAAMSAPLWDLAYVCVEGALDAQEQRALLTGYGDTAVTVAHLRDWQSVARAVSAAWCMARAALGEASAWQDEIANRLAALAADLDDGATAQPGSGDSQ